jgi:hypothetical protein
MFKFADDSSLVKPASNAHTRKRELEHIQEWASENKLSLNKSKSQEIIFRKPRSRGTTDVPTIPGIQRVNSLKIIRVTLSSNFSMQEHVSSFISSSAQSLYALRVLRSHGFDDQSLQTVFQATVISKLQYSSSAWWGFTNAAQRDQLESFLRRAVKVGFHKNNSPTLTAICEPADDKLFRRITKNPCHPLHRLLPVLVFVQVAKFLFVNYRSQ